MITIKTQVSSKNKLLQNYFAERFCDLIDYCNKFNRVWLVCNVDDSSIEKRQEQLLEEVKKGEFPRFFVVDEKIYEITGDLGDIPFSTTHSKYSSEEEAIKTLESFHVDYFVITEEIAKKCFS